MSDTTPGRPLRLHPALLATVQRELLEPAVLPGLSAFVASDHEVPEMVQLSRDAFGGDAMNRSDFAFYLHRAHALVFGLKKDGAVVSYCILELNAGQHRIYVVETCTAPALRGHGYGFWLRTRVTDIARHLGYRHIASHVAVNNTRALRLNEKVGMVVIRRLERYYDDGRDAYYLRKTIDEAPAAEQAAAEAPAAGADTDAARVRAGRSGARSTQAR